MFRPPPSSIFASMLLLLPIAPSALSQELKIVASFSILADMTRQVGGDRVSVQELVGPDQDAHVYQPTPADARMLSEADVVVINGLGFEGWIERLVVSAGYEGPVVVATENVPPLALPSGEQDHAHLDPHAWQSLSNARIYARNITDGLAAADAQGAAAYAANLGSYLNEITYLEQEISAAVARIPMENRRVITSHDAFNYFAQAYGFAFLAPLGVSSDTEASARDVAALIRQSRADNVGAIFVENISDPRLIGQIAEEAGITIGGTLYSDALSGPGGPAATYLDMMLHNTFAIINALAEGEGENE